MMSLPLVMMVLGALGGEMSLAARAPMGVSVSADKLTSGGLHHPNSPRVVVPVLVDASNYLEEKYPYTLDLEERLHANPLGYMVRPLSQSAQKFMPQLFVVKREGMSRLTPTNLIGLGLKTDRVDEDLADICEKTLPLKFRASDDSLVSKLLLCEDKSGVYFVHVYFPQLTSVADVVPKSKEGEKHRPSVKLNAKLLENYRRIRGTLNPIEKYFDAPVELSRARGSWTFFKYGDTKYLRIKVSDFFPWKLNLTRDLKGKVQPKIDLDVKMTSGDSRPLSLSLFAANMYEYNDWLKGDASSEENWLLAMIQGRNNFVKMMHWTGAYEWFPEETEP